jgi:hypothetical protein
MSSIWPECEDADLLVSDAEHDLHDRRPTTGDCSIVDVPFGNYWAVETTAVPGRDLAADQSFSLAADTPDRTISLTFVDPRQAGAIHDNRLR